MGALAVFAEQVVVVSPAPEKAFLMLWPSVLAKKTPPLNRMTVSFLTFQATPRRGWMALYCFGYVGVSLSRIGKSNEPAGSRLRPLAMPFGRSAIYCRSYRRPA